MMRGVDCLGEMKPDDSHARRFLSAVGNEGKAVKMPAKENLERIQKSTSGLGPHDWDAAWSFANA